MDTVQITLVRITYKFIIVAFANPLYLNPDEMDTFDHSGEQPPDNDGTF